MAPYKKPESDLPDNGIYNNHVSMLRIRSEHAIGFLKGRFQSLKDLRVMIKDENSHKFATYWIVACIGIHSFAMTCEAEEKGDLSDDSFIAQGASTDASSDLYSRLNPTTQDTGPNTSRSRSSTLAAAKARREVLKAKLLHAQEVRAQRRAMHNGDSSESD